MEQTASTAPSWLVETVKLLASGDATAPQRSELSVRRIGRNQVWRISRSRSPETVYYAKLWRKRTVFAREMMGIELMVRLSQQHPWIGHAELVYADEEQGVLVTSQIPGVTLQQYLRQMLHRGVPSRGAAVRNQQALHAFDTTLRFAQCLHELSVPQQPALAQHDTEAVKQRIRRMAAKLLVADEEVSRGVLKQMASSDFPDEIPHRCNRSLVFGDLNPSNIFFCDGRIVPIDFEDLGVGPACRDYARLGYVLEQFGRLWRYRNAAPLMDRVRQMNHCVRPSLLHHVEFLVSHLVAVHNRRRRRIDVRRVGDGAETRWITRELRIAWEAVQGRRGNDQDRQAGTGELETASFTSRTSFPSKGRHAC